MNSAFDDTKNIIFENLGMVKQYIKSRDDKYKAKLEYLRNELSNLRNENRNLKEQQLQTVKDPLSSKLVDIYDITIDTASELVKSPEPSKNETTQVIALIGGKGKSTFLHKYCGIEGYTTSPTTKFSIKGYSKKFKEESAHVWKLVENSTEAIEIGLENTKTVNTVFLDCPTGSEHWNQSGYINTFIKEYADTIIYFTDNLEVSNSDLTKFFSHVKSREKNLIIVHNYQDIKYQEDYDRILNVELLKRENQIKTEMVLDENADYYFRYFSEQPTTTHHLLPDLTSPLGKLCLKNMFYDLDVASLMSTYSNKEFSVLKAFPKN